MNISIIVPLSSDIKIKECLDSIDERVEVILSLNKPSKKILNLIKKLREEHQDLKIKVCSIEYLSIAGAYNNGIRHSSFENILLMDSDCVFKKRCIRRLYNNFNNNYLSKGKVVFRHSNWLEKIIAHAREFHTSDFVNAYSPPLIFKKDIISKIGGYYFHPALCWMEDGEFDLRVRRAGLKISYDSKAKIYHRSLSLRRDFYSAFMYGVGRRIGTILKIDKKPSGFVKSFNKYLITGAKKKGLSVGVYLYFWRLILLFGYYSQKFFHLRKTQYTQS